ncbi:FAD-dependent oxidoreductase, partial [Rhizobium johnstonii]|uniref:FAD-dependent oxidoreductase n=1 Tax=Rhizobium johnstonii TaxID=3019933 RepID=UPI003F9B7B8A
DLAVIGAGPAGLAAALTAVEQGVSVIVIDEQRSPGGQIFRRTPEEFGKRSSLPTGYPWIQRSRRCPDARAHGAAGLRPTDS